MAAVWHTLTSFVCKQQAFELYQEQARLILALCLLQTRFASNAVKSLQQCFTVLVSSQACIHAQSKNQPCLFLMFDLCIMRHSLLKHPLSSVVFAEFDTTAAQGSAIS